MKMPSPMPLLKTYALAWILLLLGFGVTALVGWSLFRHVRELDQNRFGRQVRQTTEAIRDRIEKYELALAGLADIAAVRPKFSQAEWNFRVRLLQPEKNYPGLLELGLARVETNSPPAPTDGVPGRNDDSPLPDVYALRFQHVWVCPPSAFDGISPRFLKDTVIANAARAALEIGVPTYCYRRELATEIAGKPGRGFTIFIPFSRRESGASPTNQLAGDDRPANAPEPAFENGVAFGSIEPNLMLGSLFGTAPREIGFDLFGGEPPSAKTWLNVNGASPPTLLPDFKPYLQAKTKLSFHAQEWTLILHTTALFEKESSRSRPWTAVATGAALSMLIAALLVTQIRGRLRQEEIAAELRSACEDLQKVQNERERIGRDLHDGTIQSLYGLQLSLGHFERAQSRDAGAARELLRHCRSSLDALIAEVRAFIVQHVPGDEDPARVANASAALQQLVHRFQSATRVPIELLLKDSPPTPITLAQQVHLRQIAQEALSNCLRHSRARHIQVALARQGQHLQLRVADDGVGFDYPHGQSGHGLANMQARSVQLGGRLQIQSETGRGTVIVLEMPVEPEPANSDGKES